MNAEQWRSLPPPCLGTERQVQLAEASGGSASNTPFEFQRLRDPSRPLPRGAEDTSAEREHQAAGCSSSSSKNNSGSSSRPCGLTAHGSIIINILNEEDTPTTMASQASPYRESAAIAALRPLAANTVPMGAAVCLTPYGSQPGRGTFHRLAESSSATTGTTRHLDMLELLPASSSQDLNQANVRQLPMSHSVPVPEAGCMTPPLSSRLRPDARSGRGGTRPSASLPGGWRSTRSSGGGSSSGRNAARRTSMERSMEERLPAEMRRRLSREFGSQRTKKLKSWKDLHNWLVPEGRGQYWALWTLAFSCLVLSCFFFMAGQLQAYLVSQAVPGSSEWNGMVKSFSTGPTSFVGWLAFWSVSDSGMGANAFGFKYLLLWGGKYGPIIAEGQWWRWLTSLAIHQSFSHVLSNMVLFLLLSGYLEHNYGTLRILIIFIVSGLVGNFSSTIFEDPCQLVVGASGCVFGLVGLYISDIVLNFESMALPWLRLGALVLGLVFLITTQVTYMAGSGNSVSNFSHLGGGLTGLFMAIIFLPNLKDKRWRALEKLASRMKVSEALSKVVRRVQGYKQEPSATQSNEEQQQAQPPPETPPEGAAVASSWGSIAEHDAANPPPPPLKLLSDSSSRGMSSEGGLDIRRESPVAMLAGYPDGLRTPLSSVMRCAVSEGGVPTPEYPCLPSPPVPVQDSGLKLLGAGGMDDRPLSSLAAPAQLPMPDTGIPPVGPVMDQNKAVEDPGAVPRLRAGSTATLRSRGRKPGAVSSLGGTACSGAGMEHSSCEKEASEGRTSGQLAVRTDGGVSEQASLIVQSCWSRNRLLWYAVYTVCVLYLLLAVIAQPLYIYLHVLPSMECK